MNLITRGQRNVVFTTPLVPDALGHPWRSVQLEGQETIDLEQVTPRDGGVDRWQRRQAVLWGVAFANIVRGVAIDADGTYTGGFFALLSPFALLGGLTTLALFLSHGAIFLSLKTDGVVRERAESLAKRLSATAVVVAGAWAVWTQLAYSVAWTWAAVGVAAASLVAAYVAVGFKRFGWAFVASAVAIVAAVVLIFGSLYPDVMPSTTNAAFSLTVHNASSTHYTLTIMTWVALALTPVVLAYQAWTYWVFRRRLRVEDIPAHSELTFRRG